MVLILESRSHLDLGDLPNMLAAELGVMTVRLERAVRSLDGVARVHVNRWGDGSAHLHLWFLARPHGRLQLRGTFLSLWDEILPPIPEYQWRENLALVAAWLAEFGGTPLAEPPRIDWKSPATLTPAAESVAGVDGADGSSAGDRTLTNVSESAGTADGRGGSDGTAASASEATTDQGDTATAGESAATPGRWGGAGTTDPAAAGGDDSAQASAVPAQSASADEIQVIPGPAGFPPIGDLPTRQRAQAGDTSGPVPGQRDGSADSRDPAAAAPA
jgi:hypothetical protein